MKNQHLTALILVAVTACCVSSSSAQPDCNENSNLDATTFEGTVDNAWNVDGNWSFGSPNSSKTACIPANQSVIIGLNVHGQAKHLWIQADAVNTGRVTIAGTNTNPASLTLSGDSTIDGELNMEWQSRLKINGQIIIDGAGDLILDAYDEAIFPTIEGIGVSPKLTILGSGVRAESLILSGTGDVDVELVNDSYVVADYDGELAINQPASGNGFWMAEKHPIEANEIGTLVINAAVTGGGTWVLADNSTAEIRINTASTALTGDVTVHKGIFTLNADFTTSGNLEYRSIGGSTPGIRLKLGVIGVFDQ